MNPRLMRLKSDYDRISEELSGRDVLTVEPVGPILPPERYLVTYRVPGFRWDARLGQAVTVHEHVADIYLHAGYPREKPRCLLRTEIWHPNFGNYICIGDFWAAGETLVDIIVQIGDMIQYKTFNTKSPVNTEAAKWADRHRGLFPVGRVELRQPQVEIDLTPAVQAPASPGLDFTIEFGRTTAEEDVEIDLTHRRSRHV